MGRSVITINGGHPNNDHCMSRGSMQAGVTRYARRHTGVFTGGVGWLHKQDLLFSYLLGGRVVAVFFSFVSGPPLYIGGGGGWSSYLTISIYFTREMESFICSPQAQDRLYFHHALWTFIYFTHFPTQIISKKLQPPPPILMVAPFRSIFYCWSR